MKKIAFYAMNQKGFAVIENFIDRYGSSYIEYIVSEKDEALKFDAYNQVKELAASNGIAFFNRRIFDENIEREFSGVKLAIGWRWLIKSESNLVVFHDSLLPKYRGFAPLVNSLINGESQVGVTALFASDEYDQGDIVCQQGINIKYPVKIKDVISAVEPIYFDLVEKVFLSNLDGIILPRETQDHNKATYSLWLDQEDYFIDWSWSAQKIRRFIDAVGYPYDGAKANFKNEVVVFNDVEETNDVYVEHRERHIGKVVLIQSGFPVVVCTSGLLVLKDIKKLNGQCLSINFRSRFK